MDVRLVDLAVLLYNLRRAASDPEIGFDDADRTLHEILEALNRRVEVKMDLVSSLMWAANMLHEQQKWDDVRGYTFEEFVKTLTAYTRTTFNKDYNLLEPDERRRRRV